MQQGIAKIGVERPQGSYTSAATGSKPNEGVALRRTARKTDMRSKDMFHAEQSVNLKSKGSMMRNTQENMPP